MTSSQSRDNALDRDAYDAAERDFHALKKDLPEDALASLAREVVERLAKRRAEEVRFSSQLAIDLLCRALLSDDRNLAMEMVQDIYRAGTSVEELYVGYLGAAARRLGEWWDADEVTFVEVTMGVSRIYAILRVLRPLMIPAQMRELQHAVFAAVPGDTHTLGITMAADLYRKSGWRVDLLIGREHDELVSEVDMIDAPVIGLSAGGEHAVVPLTKLIVALRVTNPSACLLVGGKILETNPDIITLAGADGMAGDVETTTAAVERFYRLG